MSSFRLLTANLCGLAWLMTAGCGPGADKPLGPSDSYLLFASAVPPAQSPGGLPVLRPLAVNDGPAQKLSRLFAEGFASEMLRTVYLAKQFVQRAAFEGRTFAEAGRAGAAEPVCFVVGAERDALGRGLAMPRFIGAPVERPRTLWLGVTAALEKDKAAVQTMAARLATHALSLITTGGTLAPDHRPAPLAEAYRMAMEVIAREWRVGSGPEGVVAFDAGTPAQRRLFADIRENRLVLAEDGATLRPAREILDDSRVAATVLYRLAQSKGVGQRVAPEGFYAPFNLGRPPEGIHPAALLGAFRNFQAKLLGSWGKAVLAGRSPAGIVDLLAAYMAEFPAERAEATRIFLVTTFAATVKPGGVSTRPQDAKSALAELTALTAEVVAGRRTLQDALAPPGGPGDAGQAIPAKEPTK